MDSSSTAVPDRVSVVANKSSDLLGDSVSRSDGSHPHSSQWGSEVKSTMVESTSSTTRRSKSSTPFSQGEGTCSSSSGKSCSVNTSSQVIDQSSDLKFSSNSHNFLLERCVNNTYYGSAQ